MKNWIFVGLIILVIGGGIGWIVYESNRPLPGQTVPDLGRTHVPDGTHVDYNSNPPTSGSHYPEWVPTGVYSKVAQESYLVHSLEHGYIIMSYNCMKTTTFNFTGKVFAADVSPTPLQMRQGNFDQMVDATESAKLSGGQWDDQSCRDLVSNLTGIYNKRGKHKLIVIPRPSLDSRIALTAWTRIDKFNDFDEDRINKFIDAFRDKGPEATVEQP